MRCSALKTCIINNYYYNDLYKYNVLNKYGFEEMRVNKEIVKNKIEFILTKNKHVTILNILQKSYFNNIVIYIDQKNTTKLTNMLHHNDYSYMQITPILLYTNINETMKSCMYRIFIVNDIEMIHYMTSYEIMIMVDPLICTMRYCNAIIDLNERTFIF